jgi:chromate transporter
MVSKKQLYWDVFVAFFRSTMLGYGGGPSTIPLVHKEVVQTYQWTTDEEFAEIFALGNALPGPIATKMAGFIGYRVAGWIGMIIATLATVIPTVLLMIGLLSFLYSFKDSPYVQGMTSAIKPVVAVMLAALAYDFIKKSGKEQGWKLASVLGIASLVVLLFGVHPALVIGVLLLAAIVWPMSAVKKASTPKKGEA